MTKEDLQTLKIGDVLEVLSLRGGLYKVKELVQSADKKSTRAAHLTIIDQNATSWIITSSGTDDMFSKINIMSIEEYPEYYI